MRLSNRGLWSGVWAMVMACAALAAEGQTAAGPPPARFDFQGKLLVVASDTDMLPSAYADGKLGPEAGVDVLSVIRLGGPIGGMRVATAEVTNSVTGPPAAVAVTPDGRFAIVAETQGKRPAGKPDATMKDLAPGRRLTVVDLTEPDRPRVVQQIDSYERAVSVAVNAAGTLVAVTFSPEGHAAVPLVLFHLRNGRLTEPTEPSLPGYGPTDELSDAEFLDAQGALGVVYTSDDNSRLQLLHYADANGRVSLTPWGNEVRVDASPYLVKFSPDGRFAVVNSMHVFGNGRGTVTSIRLGVTDAKGVIRHEIVSRVDAGKFPEGLAISPDGRWVATANLENSYLPVNDPEQRYFASISLFRMQAAEGTLEKVGDFAFDGLLPEPLVFDNSSRFLATGSFGRYDDPHAGGQIDFWRIVERNPQPGRVELVRLNESVPVARGPQSMAIVR